MREGSGNVADVLAVGGGGAVLVLSELESMAARQQREIAQQRRLLEQKEARLAVLRGAQEPAQQDRLARLRHKLDQQQSKLNRLRLLRSQTDQSRVNNATLTSDLDCIRALFNEKEKELSLAVAKVEELTRQLEELRGRQNAPAGGGSAGNVGGGLAGATGNGHLATPASAELEKLRRELMYRNKMNEQQNQMVSQQRQALAQRQAEMASIDARIAQLQSRLQRKRALNQRLAHQLGPNGGGGRGVVSGANNAGFPDTKLDGFNNGGKLRPTGNIAAIEPYSHIPNDNDFNLNKNDPKYQTLPYNTKFTVNFKTIEDDVNKNKIQHSASASQLGQRPTFQQYGHQIVHSQSQSHIQGQSQLLGSNQQQQQQHNQNLGNQPATIQSSTYNNNNNNNNNNNSNNFNSDNLSQGLRLHQSHQQQSQTQQHQNSNVQQKQHNVTGISGASTTSNVVGVTVPSITQTAQNSHRNLQQTVGGHQKPVSSVAPSFSVKSQIYQTSSTKIHPVMPQTLSLLGRGHNNNNNNNTAQNYIGNNQQQAAVTTQLQSNVGNQETNYRHGYSGVQQQQQQQQQQQYPNQAGIHASSPAAVYQAQNSSNLTGFHGTVATTFGNSSQKYNQSSQISSSNDLVQNQDQNQVLNSQKVKFEPGKSQDKFEHALPSSNKHEQQQQQQNRYDQNLTSKYESQQQSGKHDPVGIQAKHEQHLHNVKYESGCQNSQQYSKHEQQQQHEGRLPIKYDPTFKHEPSNTNQYKTEYKPESNKYESGQSKFEAMPTKYEQNSTTKHVVDHVIAKFEIPAKTPYEFDSRSTTKNNDGERKNFNESRMDDKTKPALPPKPSKPNPPPRLTHHEKADVPSEGVNEGKMTNANLNSRSDKDEDIPPIPTSEPPESPTETQLANHQIIKARPLTLKKAPISEQPKLRYKSNVHVSINRRIEMPPAFLFPETEIPADLMQTEQQQQQQQQQSQQQIIDTTDNCKSSVIGDDIGDGEKLEEADIIDALNVINIEDKPSKMKTDSELTGEVEIDGGKISEVMRRKKGNLKSSSTTGTGSGKVNLSRRVSFDPLALLLDASLEGELELVKKTAKEVANPSSANDEGITALHNAICAGHLEIVKFLVEFGCDVNAQDSDGWTPLHCAASCNNLSMVRFLVEHGACIFATTLSDHETAAEKCEEDEEGFDGCSEYLYSVQEKLGIMNNGQVYAVFDYEAQHADELSLKNGDSVVVLRKGDDNEREWWWSKLGHKEGYVPRNLLGLYPRVQPAKTVD
ncbi:putative uncharacterized protein DDB_G0271606 isoform X2 [Camponotus floridanus]|uniref:putative uncharacterized protein DDB_G0271606 isoform X2 n=1 Tax=Camponotus floridanus TaxID=104421 RepID=UPI00059CBC29|nr:putative uncharacterized protein DDB_G0271606 isoform X2 [Camponotus floridanus]